MTKATATATATDITADEIIGMGIVHGEWVKKNGEPASSVQWNEAARLAATLHPLIGKTISRNAVNDAIGLIEENGGAIALKIIDPILAVAREQKRLADRQKKIDKLVESQGVSPEQAEAILDIVSE